ncbi:MAG: ATP-binding protein, partial [Azovibrio sp.]
QSGQPGSGLGLSIALRIVELHGAEMTLDQSVTGGLRARVRFPVVSVSVLLD